MHVRDEAVEVGDRDVVGGDERVVLVGEDALLRKAVPGEPHRVRLELLRGAGAAVNEDHGGRLLCPVLSGTSRLAGRRKHGRDNEHNCDDGAPPLPLQSLRHRI